MKPRLILWYALMIPQGMLFLAIMIVETLMMLAIATFDVIEVLAFRFELWAKYNDPHALLNDPYKRTLTEVFVQSLEGRS